MTVIVAGHIDVEPGRREEFLAGRQAGIAASRAEAGCIEYVLSADSSDPGRVRIFERWETIEDLRAHLAGMAAQPPSAGGVPRLATELVQYEVSGSGPLGS